MKKICWVVIGIFLTVFGICIYLYQHQRPTDLTAKLLSYKTDNQKIEYGDYTIILEQYVYDKNHRTVAGRIKIEDENLGGGAAFGENYIAAVNESLIFYLSQSGDEESECFHGSQGIQDDAYIYFHYTLKHDTYDNKIYVYADPNYRENMSFDEENDWRVYPGESESVGCFVLDET